MKRVAPSFRLYFKSSSGQTDKIWRDNRIYTQERTDLTPHLRVERAEGKDEPDLTDTNMT